MEKPGHQKEDEEQSAPRPPGVDALRLVGVADDGCVPDYRRILAKSKPVPASFAQNDVKNTVQWRKGGATI
jgi:hypothetical protein